MPQWPHTKSLSPKEEMGDSSCPSYSCPQSTASSRSPVSVSTCFLPRSCPVWLAGPPSPTRSTGYTHINTPAQMFEIACSNRMHPKNTAHTARLTRPVTITSHWYFSLPGRICLTRDMWLMLGWQRKPICTLWVWWRGAQVNINADDKIGQYW